MGVIGGSSGQLGDVGCDPPNLVVREHIRLPRLVLVLAEIGVCDRLTVGDGLDECPLKLVDGPGSGEAARGRG
jgi:hypothetical protein